MRPLPPERDYSHEILTIPNGLTVFRILLIPVFMRLYIVRAAYLETALILALSGLSDALDGFIARRYHMISQLGKALDPVADKLTQAAMLFCLVFRFRWMLVPLLLLVVKELTGGIMSLVILRRSGEVYGADWHGKVTTFLLYAMMIVHVIWWQIPAAVSQTMTAVCVAMMLVSFFLYFLRNLRLLREHRPQT